MADQTPQAPQLDINILVDRFQAEIAQLSGRAIYAEAELIALRQANEIQRQVIENFRADQVTAEAPAE